MPKVLGQSFGLQAVQVGSNDKSVAGRRPLLKQKEKKIASSGEYDVMRGNDVGRDGVITRWTSASDWGNAIDARAGEGKDSPSLVRRFCTQDKRGSSNFLVDRQKSVHRSRRNGGLTMADLGRKAMGKEPQIP